MSMPSNLVTTTSPEPEMLISPRTVEAKKRLQQRVRHRTAHEGKHMYFGKYVSFEGSEKLRTYQYHGEDHSLIFKHILNPMCNTLVEYLPMWLAPNLITLFGLLLVISSHVSFAYYCPSFDGEAPTWTYLYAAVAILTYQTLDNLDGKQARRTNSSSPLGLLFDHGCDAINVSVGTMTMASVMQMGVGWKTYSLVLSAHTIFFCATWEEYYTGLLSLPIINGPTEGIIIGALLKLWTAYAGASFWKQKVFFGLENNAIFALFTLFATLITLSINLINVSRSVRLRHDSLLVALTRTFPMFIVNIMAALWLSFSPTNILATYPRMSLWMIGFLNCKLVLHLMLAHLCGEEYHPFRKTLVPLLYVAGHWSFSIYEGMLDGVNEGLFLKEFFFLSFASYIHIVISVIWEVKNVLGINVFTINTKQNMINPLDPQQKKHKE